jgi:nitronate monooxygenase
MWSRTVLTERLGLTYPIIQAPLATIATAPLAAAVSASGGLGFLGSATMTVPQILTQVEEVRRRTDRPFGLNFFVHREPHPDPAAAERMRRRLEPYRRELGLPELGDPFGPPPFGAAQLEVVLELRPAVASFHFGLPDPAARAALRTAGIMVFASATTVDEARLLQEGGVDAVIAQGFEAGGHRGTFASAYQDGQIGTMALLPQVVDAVSVPVIAAGGIADGRGIAAARLLGAAAVQMGTAFLGCPEVPLEPLYRRTLFEPRVARTRITRLLSGRPGRAIATRYLAEMDEAEALEFPLQRTFTSALAKAGVERGDPEFLGMWAGQAAPLLRSLPAAELLAWLATGTDEALARL